MKYLFMLIISVLVLISCAVPQRKIETNTDKNSPEYRLKEARLTLSKGDFQGAVDLYLNIFNDTAVDTVFREDALFSVGMLYSDEAASIEDYEIALKYLRQLSSTFPKTQYKEKTNREIRYIQNQMKRLKKK